MTKDRDPILIFQIASMGDTVVSIPCYREIARRHPDAKRYLLSNRSIGSKMVPAQAILSGTGLITGCLEYPWPLRGTGRIIEVYKKIADLGAKTLYYLTSETKLTRLIRHYAFFKICGITKIYGVPWARDIRYPREITKGHLWESEASRLLRCIRARTEPGPPPLADRSLDLSDKENSVASSALQWAIGSGRFIAVSVGGKILLKDWGQGHWSGLLARLSREHPGLGVLFVGSADERGRNDLLAKAWEGPCFNSCGLFSPRETAALLARSCLFIGHDTGTLHLAAATNTPIIGIYGARNVPGKWYSDRPEDTFFYNRIECFGCECLAVADCPHERRCITSIKPDEVFAAAQQKLVRYK